MAVKLGQQQSTCVIGLIRLTHGHSARSWRFHSVVTHLMQKLVAWWCSPLSSIVRDHSLRFVGYIVHSAPHKNHHCSVAATIWLETAAGKTFLHMAWSELLNPIWDHWTSVLHMHGSRQIVKNADVRLWTQLRSGGEYHEEKRVSVIV